MAGSSIAGWEQRQHPKIARGNDMGMESIPRNGRHILPSRRSDTFTPMPSGICDDCLDRHFSLQEI